MNRCHAIFLTAAMLTLAACEPSSDQSDPGDHAPTEIDPRLILPGDSVGPFVVASMDAHPAPEDGWYGRALFSGEAVIAGLYHAFDPAFDGGEGLPCFRVDVERSDPLPRFIGDERYAWFCFENEDAVATALGPPGDQRPVAVVISAYHYVHEPTDAFNLATFESIAETD